VDIDTVRYTVPHRLVRTHVDVAVADDRVQIVHAGELVAAPDRPSR
jgi:hypothetical protein